MRIRGWFIEGFGVFRDYEVLKLGDGLTIFLGPNEAGKTTLLAFVRGALFGFPDGRSRETRYLPLRGGRHLGRLFLADEDGEYALEREAGGRRSAQVFLPDGSPGGETDLRRLLGGADQRLFRSVFAFSLTELQSFKSLTDEGVRDRIFSAGIAGAGRSAREALAELEAQAARLLRQGAGRGRINELERELLALEAEIVEARRTAHGYGELLAREQESENEVGELTDRVQALAREIRRLEMLVELWPAWHERAEAEVVLAPLEQVDAFPDEPGSQLAGLLEELRGAEGRLEELKDEQASAERRRGELTLDKDLAAVGHEVEDLHENLALHRDQLGKLPGAQVALTQAKELVEEILRELGPGWDEERLASFDRSIPRREEVRGWEERLREQSEEVAAAARKLVEAEEKKRETERVRDRIKASLPEEEPPEGPALDEEEQVLARLRANLADLHGEEAKETATEATVNDRERAPRALETERGWAPPGWLVPAAGLGAAALLAAAGWRAVEGDARGAGAMLVVSLIAAALAFVVVRLKKRSDADDLRRQEVLRALETELEEARADLEAHRAEVRRLTDALAEDARALGLPACPSAQAVEERAVKLSHQREERRRFDETQARLEEAAADLRAAEEGEQREVDALAEAKEKAEKEQAAWTEWKAGSRIPEGLTPGGALDFFEAIRRGRESLQGRERAESELRQLERELAAWEGRARAALRAVDGESELSGEELVDQVLALQGRCREDEEARTSAAALDEEIRTRVSKIKTAEALAGRCDEQLAALFAEADATDEEDFRRKLGIFRERQRLSGLIHDRENQVVSRIGQGEEAEALRAELATGQVGEWRKQKDSAETEVTEANTLRDAELRRHQDNQRERRALEESSDVPRLEARHEALRAELAEAAHEWRVVTTAKTLIEETLRAFERTRQPDVLAHAAKAFTAVTGGRYERLVQEGDREGPAIFDQHGARKGVGELSRGTAEQLYLCIRLGLAAEFGRRSCSLPLVMDDVLVNFDPARSRAMAGVLVEFAREHQVLFFTCHPETRDLLLAASPDVRVIEMGAEELGTATVG